MKNYNLTAHYQFEEHWYLGFLGLVGFYKMPEILLFFQGNGTAWSLFDLLWLLWLLYFLPTEETIKDESI